jgi:hypothetical protein
MRLATIETFERMLSSAVEECRGVGAVGMGESSFLNICLECSALILTCQNELFRRILFMYSRMLFPGAFLPSTVTRPTYWQVHWTADPQ